MRKAPLPGTWWVKDGLLLAGGYPGDYHGSGTRTKLKTLLETGVRCFISLQQPNEMAPCTPAAPYEPEVRELADALGVDVMCCNFPIVDMDIPGKALMRDILEVVEKAVAEERCVYVHCWGGHGRTGTVVGCWLREHGFSGEEALRHIEQLRRHDPHLVAWESPQTRAQRDMILHWPQGQA